MKIGDRKKPASNEHEAQADLFEWAFYKKHEYPELEALYAIPNAGKRNRKYDPVRKKWYSIEGARLKQEGMKKGMPDVCLPVRRGPYGALYIEMKDAGKKPDKDQVACHELLTRLENRVVVCYSWHEAADEITAYLNRNY